MRILSNHLLLGALTALLLTACGAAIGDDCSSNTQCPAGSYCDLTMPDGMCTIANCRQGDCPDDSVCIEFPNRESYCMARCTEDGDCRGGYDCITDLALWGFCSVRE